MLTQSSGINFTINKKKKKKSNEKKKKKHNIGYSPLSKSHSISISEYKTY